LERLTAYLDFPGGSGIALVTAYGQVVSPLTRDRTLYTFQGLTQDGQSYISLVWPVETSTLPATYNEGLAGQTYEAFAQQYDAYLARTTQTLNAQAPAAFAPDLSLLDGLLRSLRITAS
ncbi:MAG: hypothetical protein M3442_04845, partial [Chloroflexota bacterium]|nr:hypothetical protein [Chloroflexota bacterium]